MNSKLLYLVLPLLYFSSCVKDDFIDDQIDPTLTITTKIDSLAQGSDFTFESQYLNNIGSREEIAVEWMSSDSEIISITAEGLATGVSSGTATISVQTRGNNNQLIDSITVTVGEETVSSVLSVSGNITTTTFYELKGSFVLEETSTGLELNIGDDYIASSALPGLYIYLSNNRNSIANALSIAAVSTFEGAHSYVIPDVSISDYNFIVYYCKPFNVKVGEAELNL